MGRWIGVLVLLLSSATKVAGSAVDVAGRVVDKKGKPIAGARVARKLVRRAIGSAETKRAWL